MKSNQSGDAVSRRPPNRFTIFKLIDYNLTQKDGLCKHKMEKNSKYFHN